MSTLRHLPFRRDISTIVAPNYVRPEPMETRRPEIFRDTKFEEIKDFEYLLKAALKHDWKKEKDEDQIWMGKKAKWVRCFGNIPPLAMGGWGGTLPKLLPIYINRTPLPLGQITNKNAQNPKNSSLSKNLFRFNFFLSLRKPPHKQYLYPFFLHFYTSKVHS